MKADDKIEAALELCIEAHGEQGYEQFMHVFSVAAQAKNEEELIVALLHDTMEDNPDIVDFDSLRRTFGPTIAFAVNILTRRSGEGYEDYISSICCSESELAMTVKLYDLEHNLSRMPSKGKKFTDRYTVARARILKHLHPSSSIPIIYGDIQTSA